MLKKGIDERRRAVADDEEHNENHSLGPKKPVVPPGPPPTNARVIEKQFADKQLGAYRGTLLYAYAEFDMASHEEQKTASLRSQNIMGEHPALMAQHTREGIQAKLEAAIEQVRFDAAQENRLAIQKLDQAVATVVDAAQRLEDSRRAGEYSVAPRPRRSREQIRSRRGRHVLPHLRAV